MSAQRWRRRFYGALVAFYRLVFPSRAQRGPLDATSVRRILVVRDDRIGDLIVTTPLLSYLRQKAPQAEVDVVCSRTNAVLLSGDDRVSRVFVGGRSWRARLWLVPELRVRQYELIFSVIAGKALLEGVFAALVGGRRAARASLWRPKRYHGLFTHVVRPLRSAQHMAEQSLRVGAATLERSHAAASVVDCARHPPRLRVADSARSAVDAFLSGAGVAEFVLVNLWTAEPGREWSPEACAPVLSRLSAKDARLAFVLTPPPGGDSDAEAVQRSAGAASRVVIFPSRFRLPELVALVARARMALTVNTSVVHIASACQRPVLGLYTLHAVDKNVHWLPLGVPQRVLFAPEGRTVSAIPADDIATAFEALSTELARAWR